MDRRSLISGEKLFGKRYQKFSLIAENFKRIYCLIGKLRGYSLRFFEPEERDIGVFAVFGVAAYRLAEGRLVARDIEDIIDYLECYAEIFGIYSRRFELFIVGWRRCSRAGTRIL